MGAGKNLNPWLKFYRNDHSLFQVEFFWEYEDRFSSPLNWQCRLITISNIVLIEIKINRNTKKERPFKNLKICISTSPSGLASTFQIFCFCLKSVSLFEKIEGVCSSLRLIIRHHYTLLQIPITLRFLIHPSRVFHWCSTMKAVWISGRIRPLLFQKKQLLRKFLEIRR